MRAAHEREVGRRFDEQHKPCCTLDMFVGSSRGHCWRLQGKVDTLFQALARERVIGVVQTVL